MERYDGARGASIGIFIQHDGGLLDFHVFTEDFLGDQHVHVEVRLMQPHAFQVVGVDAIFGAFVFDQIGNHRHDFFEDATPVLNEELVRQAAFAAISVHSVIFGRRVVQEAEVVANVI